MEKIYATLRFEPHISFIYNENNVLWKAELTIPNDVKTIGATILNDNIEFNNRRYLKDWCNLLQDNNIYFKYLFDSPHCKEFEIVDGKYEYIFRLYACDISASNPYVDIGQDHALAILDVLYLKKEGNIFPNVLLRKIEEAKTKINANKDQMQDQALSMINYLLQLSRLCKICRDYECDVKYKINQR